MAIKKCPKCGESKFKAKIIYGGIVESIENGYNIINQGQNYNVEPIQCCKCSEVFKNGEDDLVETKVCTKCGRASIDIDENGECEICRVLKSNPELATASNEDMLRMFYKMQQELASLKNNKTNASTSIQNAPDTNTDTKEEVVETTTSEEVSDEVKNKMKAAMDAVNAVKEEQKNTESETPEETSEEPKRRRRVSRKSNNDEDSVTTEETTNTEDVSTNDVEETKTPEIETNVNTVSEDPFSSAGDFDSMFAPQSDLSKDPMFANGEQAF